jgi:hypothetical protein
MVDKAVVCEMGYIVSVQMTSAAEKGTTQEGRSCPNPLPRSAKIGTNITKKYLKQPINQRAMLRGILQQMMQKRPAH